MKPGTRLIGLDLGCGFTKACDGRQTVQFPSLVGDPPDADPSREKPLGAADPPEGYAVTLDGGTVLVGSRAASEAGRPRFPRSPDRLVADFARLLAVCALSHFSVQEQPLMVVTGLALDPFRAHGEALAQRLSGFHKVRLQRAAGGNFEVCNLHIRKVHVVPHPLGTYAGLTLDPEGRPRPGRYGEGKVALVDVGFRTTTVALVHRGRLIARGCGTLDLGMAVCSERIGRRLQAESGVPVGPDALLRAMRLGFITLQGQEYNLLTLREETYRRLAEELADAIHPLLREEWDLDAIGLTGGGSGELAAHLGARLPGEVSLIECDADPRLNNVLGLLRLGRRMWGATGLCGPDG